MFNIAFIGLFVFIAGLYIGEARHDRDIERVQKTGDKSLIEAWHQSDSIFHVFMNISFAWGMFVFVPVVFFGMSPFWLEGVIMGVTLLGFRQIFMVIPLNLMRSRNAFYLGTTAKFDKIAKKFGWAVFALGGALILGGMSYFYYFAQSFSVLS